MNTSSFVFSDDSGKKGYKNVSGLPSPETTALSTGVIISLNLPNV